jgi:hypothetical protein
MSADPKTEMWMTQFDAYCSLSTCQPVDTHTAVDKRRLTPKPDTLDRILKRSSRAMSLEAISGTSLNGAKREVLGVYRVRSSGGLTTEARVAAYLVWFQAHRKTKDKRIQRMAAREAMGVEHPVPGAPMEFRSAIPTRLMEDPCITER